MQNIFILLAVTRNLLPQDILQHRQIVFLVEGMPKAGQRFRNYSSTYHTGADQNPHKMLELISFQNSSGRKTTKLISVQWVETSSREPKSRIGARTRRGNTEE